ncbi:MAG: hypothetical protein WDZ35_07350 [Crocinitomicaceae bacterium]
MKWKGFVFLLLFSCQSDTEKTDEVNNSYPTQDVINTSDTLEEEILEEEITQSMILPSIDLTKTYRGHLLEVGQYHGDEVDPQSDKWSWLGLFSTVDSSYLAKTEITTRRVYDGIVDEPGDTTGWAISIGDSARVLMLISGIDFLFERTVAEYKWEENYVAPGDKNYFHFLEHDYYLQVTADEPSNEVDLKNLKMFVGMKNESGKWLEQKLFNVEYGMSPGVKLIFLGDIDGDNRLDIITDNSYHYNVYLPTLYLSRPADEGKLVKEVAQQQSVGC